MLQKKQVHVVQLLSYFKVFKVENVLKCAKKLKMMMLHKETGRCMLCNMQLRTYFTVFEVALKKTKILVKYSINKIATVQTNKVMHFFLV